MGGGVQEAGALVTGTVLNCTNCINHRGLWFGVATSKLQLSVAPSVPFDGILLKHPRLMLVVAFGGAGMCWLGSGEEGWAGWWRRLD